MAIVYRKLAPALVFGIIAGIAIFLGISYLPDQGSETASIDGFDTVKKFTDEDKLYVKSFIVKHPVHRAQIEQFVKDNPSAPKHLRSHDLKAVYAFNLLESEGLDILEKCDIPSFSTLVSNADCLALKPSLNPVKKYLNDLAQKDAQACDNLFLSLSRVPTDTAILKEHPEALTVLAVAPRLGEKVIESFGNDALDTILNFTPDSYPVMLQVMDTEGERFFRAKKILKESSPEYFENNPGKINSFLGLYFIEYANMGRELERSLGTEQAIFFVSRNFNELHQLKLDGSEHEVESLVFSLVDYLKSTDLTKRKVANICLSQPDALAFFRHTASVSAIRDEFITSHGDTGGIMIVSRYARKFWVPFIKATVTLGDSAMLPLSSLDAYPAFNELLEEAVEGKLDKALEEFGKDPIELILKVLTQALTKGVNGESEGLNWSMLERTLEMMTEGDYDDIPDDFIDRKISWVWDILPGRDAFRLARLLLKGYVPTLGETVTGLWDAGNVAFFVYSAGSSAIDCTRGVMKALGEQSFKGLGHALQVVGEATVKKVFSRLIQSVTNPRNYIKLALAGGYFAYDYALRNDYIDLPNKAQLLEINEQYLTPWAKRTLLQTAAGMGNDIFLGLSADFKLKDLKDFDELSKDGQIVMSIENMKKDVYEAINKLLSRNEQRRRLVKWMFEFFEDRPLYQKQGEEKIEAWRRAAKTNAEAWIVLQGQKRSKLGMERPTLIKTGVSKTPITGERFSLPETATALSKYMKTPRFIFFTLETLASMLD